MSKTRTLLLCGVVGPPVVIVTFLIEGATRPGNSWWRNYVSSLATGGSGWVQIANFLVWGTLAIGFAIGVVRVGLVVPGMLLFLYGAGLLVAGVFVTDPSLDYSPGAPAEHTTHGKMHGLAGLGVFALNAGGGLRGGTALPSGPPSARVGDLLARDRPPDRRALHREHRRVRPGWARQLAERTDGTPAAHLDHRRLDIDRRLRVPPLGDSVT